MRPAQEPTGRQRAGVARFEQREEYERANLWRGRFVEELQGFLDVWTPVGTDVRKLVDLLTVPYVPRWTFGEELAALQEEAGSTGSRAPGQAVSYALETLAAVLARGFAGVELLVSSRDEYVHAARAELLDRRTAKAGAPRVFLSHSMEDVAFARVVADALRQSGLEVWTDALSSTGQSWPHIVRVAVESSSGYVIVVGPAYSRAQKREVETIQRHSLRSSLSRPIIPVVLPGGEEAFQESSLANFAAHHIKPSNGPVFDQMMPAIRRLQAAVNRGGDRL